MKPVCEVTHSQITAGKCPWCGEPIGEVNSEQAAGETVWNVDAMAAALEDGNSGRGAITLTNLCNSGLPFEVTLPLFSKALKEKSSRVAVHAEQHLERLGGDLQTDDVARLEAKIAGSPNELALRILVLSYYFLGQRESEAARKRRHEHIDWMIQHAPESQTAGSPQASIHEQRDAQGFENAKQLWLEQVKAHPGSAQIHGNAACFFTLRDPSLSESLLEKARDLEPSNPNWPERLGHLYSLQSRGNSVDARTSAAKAFRALAAAEALREQEVPELIDETGEQPSEEEKRTHALLMAIWNLPQLAKAAFEAHEFEQARNYATELLEKATSEAVPEFFRHDGNAIHHANLILGRLAFREGDVERAKQYLIASGKTKGSPQLGSFGPNMSLAKELLECGEPEAVLRYFELCRIFWGSHGEVLDRWTEDVRAGRIPQFGANLVY